MNERQAPITIEELWTAADGFGKFVLIGFFVIELLVVMITTLLMRRIIVG